MSASTTAFVQQRNMKDGHVSWNTGKEWSNFTESEIRKFENDCESQFNTEAEIKKCVASKIGARAEKSGSGNSQVDWGAAANSAIDFFNQYRDNKNAGSSTYTPDTTPTKNGNGLLIGGAVVVGLGGAAWAIWYFGFRKKGK